MTTANTITRKDAESFLSLAMHLVTCPIESDDTAEDFDARLVSSFAELSFLGSLMTHASGIDLEATDWGAAKKVRTALYAAADERCNATCGTTDCKGACA